MPQRKQHTVAVLTLSGPLRAHRPVVLALRWQEGDATLHRVHSLVKTQSASMLYLSLDQRVGLCYVSNRVSVTLVSSGPKYADVVSTVVMR